jgi:hypothetical protein
MPFKLCTPPRSITIFTLPFATLIFIFKICLDGNLFIIECRKFIGQNDN